MRLYLPTGVRRGHETVCDEKSHTNKQNKGREFDSIVKAKQRNCFTTTSWRGKHIGFNTCLRNGDQSQICDGHTWESFMDKLE